MARFCVRKTMTHRSHFVFHLRALMCSPTILLPGELQPFRNLPTVLQWKIKNSYKSRWVRSKMFPLASSLLFINECGAFAPCMIMKLLSPLYNFLNHQRQVSRQIHPLYKPDIYYDMRYINSSAELIQKMFHVTLSFAMLHHLRSFYKLWNLVHLYAGYLHDLYHMD